MTPSFKKEFIQDFGEAYKRFGLPTLMGRIVGLLLYMNDPVTLDEISKQLNVSKGPVSQVMHRLRDHRLIQRIWIPGDRKDYYQVEEDIFGNAFRNQAALMKRNLDLAQKYKARLDSVERENEKAFRERIEEMRRFYDLMQKHFNIFLDEWAEKKHLNAQ